MRGEGEGEGESKGRGREAGCPPEPPVTDSMLRVAVTYLRDLDHGGRLHVGQLLDTALTPNHVAHLKTQVKWLQSLREHVLHKVGLSSKQTSVYANGVTFNLSNLVGHQRVTRKVKKQTCINKQNEGKKEKKKKN